MKFAPYSRAAMLAGVLALLPATTAGLAAVDARSGPQFNKLIAIYQLIKANYVEPVSDDKLIKGAIDGMLTSLDPHSAYLDGASLQRLETMIDGRYSGLGLSVMMDDGAVKIISPMRGSPAEKAGLKAGDFITHLDGKLQYGGDIDEAVSKMRGEAGTSIRLTIFRPGRDEPFDVTVTRGVIDLKPVTSKFENGIGVISVNEFSRNVGTQVMAEIQGMRQAQGTRLSGLVLDLRSNPGGSLDEAVALSDLFLTSGTIVSQRGRVASENEYYRAESMIRGDGARGLPLVVLIDAGSASASEIVAGALQDNKRAVIMGERSFGKGSVQQMISLDRTSAIKITTARYYTPLGKSVQEGGIEPDIRVPQISDPDMRKRAERQMRESDLRGHLINEISLDEKQLETDKQDDPRFKMTAAELQAKGIKDFQLYYAIETLRRTSPSVVAARRP
jgi:carboxyl-terminal processing protease